MAEQINFIISTLGEAKIPSPVQLSKKSGDKVADFVPDNDLIAYDLRAVPETTKTWQKEELLEKAGPREKIFFNPAHVHAAIVTCGGLCPGLNDVIRSLVRCLWLGYGVRRITGIKNGFRGFLAEFGYLPIQLDPDVVDDIHHTGGTILGSSRGYGERTVEIVDALEAMNVNMLFVIGGDGTQKGSNAICNEVEKRGLKIAVVGIPKTIDNDIRFVEKTFGFETAVSMAANSVQSAHTEAHSAVNGIGLVKLMGRESGFIAAHTALAMDEANFVFIPEIPFDLEGPNGLMAKLKERLINKNHAVIIVAEGAGQEHLKSVNEKDASGNKKLADIGLFLKDEITEFFKNEKMEINLKYIDPSYIIRSAPVTPADALYCTRLGNQAVHAAMAGKTGLIISELLNVFVHVPIDMAVSGRKTLNPEGSLWRDVLMATGQPLIMTC